MNNRSAHTNLDDFGSPVRDSRGVTFVDLIENLFYYRWHFVFVFALAVAAAAIYAILATPIYSADSLIQVEEKKGTSLGALTQVANALGAQQSPVLGEIEILRSRSVVGRAVTALNANIEVSVENRLPIVGNWLSRTRARGPDGLAIPLWSDSAISWGGELLTFELLIVPDGLIGVPLTFTLTEQNEWSLYNQKNSQIIVSGRGIEHLVESSDGFVKVKIGKLRARPGNKFKVSIYSIQSRITQVLSNLVVNETKRQSGILQLTYQSSSASFASSMLNAIMDAYLQQNIGRRSEEAELSLKFLNSELPSLRSRLDASEKALNDFRSRTKTIDISTEIRELLTKSTSIERLRVESELKLRELAERYDAAHPLMKSINSQIQVLHLENAELSRKIGQLPVVQQDYLRLARDVEVNNQLYVGLLNNAQQLQIAKAGTTGNVSIVDRAVAPERPSRPKKTLILVIGGLSGIILGFLFCQLLAISSRVVRDPKKLELEAGLPILAILPFDFDQSSHAKADGPPFLLAKENSDSASIESLRSLRTSLLFKLSEKPRSKVVLITSAVPSQGKSFISANLSYLIGASGKRVLLIEADIRMASISRYIQFPDSEVGLSTLLNQKATFENAIRSEVYPNMDFLPAGKKVRNPGDLLAGDIMAHIIAEMADAYDYVVIDSPPLLPVHDARSLGKSADVTLFVARQDSVSLDEVHDAIDVFGKSGNTLDGLVFNGFVPSRIRYGYGYGAYGYGKYHRGYGYGMGRSKYGRYGKYGD